MGETSAQDQTSQGNIHPMATGGAAMPSPYAQPQQAPIQQTLPIQSVSPPVNGNSPVTTITMRRLPLLAITLSLMLLGSLTFLGGFLLGLWLSSPVLTSSLLLAQSQPITSYIPISPQQAGQMTGGTPSQQPSG